MKDYKTTLDRLLQILNRLYLGEMLSVSELANEFGVSNRTIQRYFNNYLKNFPLQKIGQKWSLNTKIAIDKNTSIAFNTLENIAKKTGIYSKIHPYIKQLNSSNNTFLTSLKIENIDDIFNEISILNDAIKETKYISFSYKNNIFNIKPIKITNFEGYWYLVGFDDNFKSFYIKEIKNLKILDKTFTLDKIPPLQNAINAWFNPLNEIEVEFLADEYVSTYLKKIPLNPTQIIINTYPDKTTLFSIKITHFMEIEKFIKSWIPRVIILKPTKLKNKILNDLKIYQDLLNSYK